MKSKVNLEFLPYLIFLLGTVSIYLSLTSLVKYKSIQTITENFSENPLSEYREKSNKIILFPDNYDKVYTRLNNIVMNEPAIYRHDIIKIKETTGITDKSQIGRAHV